MNSRHFDIFELTIYFSLISLFIVTVVSFVLNFIYNKCEKMQKINTITSYITLAIFVPLFYKLFKYKMYETWVKHNSKGCHNSITARYEQ